MLLCLQEQRIVVVIIQLQAEAFATKAEKMIQCVANGQGESY